MAFQQNTEKILYDLKNKIRTTASPLIPVLRNSQKIAQLRVITKDIFNHEKEIKLLTNWRNKNQDAFPSKFRVTYEGTKKWTKENLIDVPDRILFFLENTNNIPYAHLGLFRFDYQKKSCEIDNVIRGREINPGTMTNALNTLIEWTTRTFGISDIYLKVFSDNKNAISLYERCGFKKVKMIPLKKIVEKNMTKFVEITDNKIKADRYFMVMKLNKTSSDITYLQDIAKKVRENILRMSYSAQSAHTGGALSCVEILTVLYFKIMKVFPSNPNSSKRDRLYFSKAHDAKVLYSILAEKKFFAKKILDKYEKNNGILPGHSTRHCVPGVEISAGSLGHGLSMAVGSAYAGKIDKKNYNVYAILSDGECDEGSTWEAALFAGHHRLDNLITIIDYNQLQGFGFTKDILNLEPFAEKWKSFGWEVKTADGHNLNNLISVLSNTPFKKEKPSLIIANTIKGLGGVEMHINQISSQYKPPTKEQLEETLLKL